MENVNFDYDQQIERMYHPENFEETPVNMEDLDPVIAGVDFNCQLDFLKKF